MEFKDATAMAKAIREKAVSSLELVEETIRVIELQNKELKAVVSTQYERARREALRCGEKQRLFEGVPILLKDLGQEQVGERSTFGSRLFRNNVARETDHFVRAVENLGFIVVGRTSTPEFGFKNISDATLHGNVSLPMDTARNAGGSSGGAASSVASGMVPIATASDGGGSIRIPASFNGLIGLKPTRGRMPVGPGSYRGWQGASVSFAMTKSVRDTLHFLMGMQVEQMESPFIAPKLTMEQMNQSINRSLRVAWNTHSPIHSKVGKEAVQAVHQAVRFLEKQGHLVEEAMPSIDGIDVMENYYVMNGVETAAMFQRMERQIGRELTVQDMELMTWAIYQSGKKVPATVYTQLLQKWDRYSVNVATFHERYDVYITPTTAFPAPLHDQFQLSKQLTEQLYDIARLDVEKQQQLIWAMFEQSLEWTPFTQLANLTGQPAISLPIFRTTEGLPIGVQVVAAKGREDLLLQVAQLFEEAGEFR